jgi:hypothetical protein
MYLATDGNTAAHQGRCTGGSSDYQNQGTKKSQILFLDYNFKFSDIDIINSRLNHPPLLIQYVFCVISLGCLQKQDQWCQYYGTKGPAGVDLKHL